MKKIILILILIIVVLSGLFIYLKKTEPTNRLSCLVRGGNWVALGGMPRSICNFPTKDGGKICTDDSQCQAGCIANPTANEINQIEKDHIKIKKEGKCSDSIWITGCMYRVQNGQIGIPLCVM